MISPIDSFEGTTVLVIRSEDTISKQLYTLAFTKTWSRSDIEDSSKFTPRILLGTSGCIGTRIDCDDVHLVIYLGLPTSILHFMQEMGRYGRNHNIELQQTNIDCYHVIFALEEFIYLTERLYLNDINEVSEDQEGDTNDKDNNPEVNSTELTIISIDEERQIQRSNLLRCLSLFSLENRYWHRILEKESGNPFLLDEPFQFNSSISCETNCP